MNKKTEEISDEKYLNIVNVLKNGFTYEEKIIRPNIRIATIVVLLYNTGININKIRNIEIANFKKNKYGYVLFDEYFVSNDLYNFILEYANNKSLSASAKLFDIGERNIQKHIANACDYLGYNNIGVKSFNKSYERRLLMKGITKDDLMQAIDNLKTIEF